MPCHGIISIVVAVVSNFVAIVAGVGVVDHTRYARMRRNMSGVKLSPFTILLILDRAIG